MEIRTHLGNAIEAIDSLKARYDKNVKELLADIQVLSRIVKHTVTEVESLSIQEIMDCISLHCSSVSVSWAEMQAAESRAARMNVVFFIIVRFLYERIMRIVQG